MTNNTNNTNNNTPKDAPSESHSESLDDYLPYTPNTGNERLQALRKLFPDMFDGEGKIKLDDLRQLQGDDPIGRERYDFSWYGKRNAKANAYAPTTATLSYDETRSVNPQKADGNLIIEGENMESLKCLLAAYQQSVKCIYIDPPYNTGKDFVYCDNYTEEKRAYWEQTGGLEDGVKVDSNPESAGRYHSNWLSMIYPRLLLSRQLLKEDGVIFVSIDDNEVHNLRRVMDEVFGEENFVAQYIHKNNSSKNQAALVSISTEYFFCYAKNRDVLKENSCQWRLQKKGVKDIVKLYNQLKRNELSLEKINDEVKEMCKRPKYAHLSRWNKVDDIGVFKDADLSREGGSKDYTIYHPVSKKACVVPDRGWGKSKEELERLQKEDLIWYGDEDTAPGLKDYINPDDVSVPDNFWYFDNSVDTKWIKNTFGSLVFENPKPIDMLQTMIKMIGLSEDDIFLDFFGGSGTGAHAVLNLNKEDGGNRKFILVQLPEQTKEKSKARAAGYRKISDITIERVKRVIEGYGETPQPLKNTGFKVYQLTPSHFPRTTFQPDFDKTEAQNIAELKAYIAEKEAQLHQLFEPLEIQDEVLLKNGFRLNYQLADAPEFTENTVRMADDGEKQALLCLDTKLKQSTVDRLIKKPQPFICLEVALTTTDKWNLRQHLKHMFVAF